MYFEGPWKIIDKDSLEQVISPGIGQVLKHRSGAVVLRCPECRAVQFTCSPVTGSDDKPTLTKPIQCGSGHCQRCGIWFSIVVGKTVVHDDDPREKQARILSSKLRKAGVKEPPKLKVGKG